jgi:hypothetical protein
LEQRIKTKQITKAESKFWIICGEEKFKSLNKHILENVLPFKRDTHREPRNLGGVSLGKKVQE